MVAVKNNLLVAMNLPTQTAQFIIKGKVVFSSMMSAPYFEDSKIALEELDTELVVLENSQKGLAQTPPLSTVVIRNAAQARVKNILRRLAADVQTVANKNPEKAAEIIQSSGFEIKKISNKAGNEDKAYDGGNEGEVILQAATAGIHEWRISHDGGTTYDKLDTTTKSSKTVTGLTPGKMVWFQNRAVLTNDTYGEWSAWYWIVPRLYR